MVSSNINIKKGSNRTYNNINNTNGYERARMVRSVAAKLVETFNSEKSEEFFLKVAWRLPEAKIWSNVEIAKAGKQNKPGHSPLRFFIYLCKVDGV